MSKPAGNRQPPGCSQPMGGSSEESFQQRIAEWLSSDSFITSEQLDSARRASREEGKDLLESLVSLGMVARGTLLTLLGLRLGVPVIDMQEADVDPEALKLVPEEDSRRHRILPVELDPDGALLIAAAGFSGFGLTDELASELALSTGLRIRFCLALGDDLDDATARAYERARKGELQSGPALGTGSIPSRRDRHAPYEGTVRLEVISTGSVQQVAHFVQELHQVPQLRILRLAPQSPTNVEIILRLREPLYLRDILAGIPEVSEVNARPSGDNSEIASSLAVRLHGTSG